MMNPRTQKRMVVGLVVLLGLALVLSMVAGAGVGGLG